MGAPEIHTKFCSVNVDKEMNYLEYLDLNFRNISKCTLKIIFESAQVAAGLAYV
jgi:hypothetical protein